MVVPQKHKKRHKDFFEFFPAPEYMLLSTAGIAITEDGVKFAQLRRQVMGGKLRVASLDWIENSETVPALKELARRHSLRYVRAALPDEKAYLFTAIIDKVPFEGLKDAVAFIVEENAPVSLVDSVFDFEVIELKDPDFLKVAVSVLPKKVVNDYIDLFKAAGITPISFEIESEAIARAIIPRSETQIDTLIINLERKKTSFYVVEDGLVEFSTTLVYQMLPNAESSTLTDLKAEMRKVYAFWNARVDKRGAPQKKIERTVLCGSGAKDAQLVSELMVDFPTEYSLADAWVNTDSVSKGVATTAAEESLDYAPAIGLSLPRHIKNHV